MNLRKLIGPLLLVVLVVGVGYAIYRSASQALRERAVVTVRGLTGSEKIDYLTDAKVLSRLRALGINLMVEKSGSREMAFRNDLSKYDFAFPAGAPAATKVMEVAKVKKSYTPFFTPMAVASWKPIVDVLAANGIVKQTGPTLYIVDLHKLFDIMRAGQRWKDLPHSDAYPVGKTVLVSTTDLRTSNSASMYLALASYVMNGDNVVQDSSQIAKVSPLIAPLFSKQGYQESSTAGPFEDYVAMGMGKAPLVLIYEAQFIEYQLQHNGVRKDMVLLYPQPTIYTKHTFVPLTPNGDKLGNLLATDPELQKLAADYGLRTNAADETKGWAAKGVQAPDQLLDVIDPPSYDVLERMITTIETGTSP
jgi:hypothetical protein